MTATDPQNYVGGWEAAQAIAGLMDQATALTSALSAFRAGALILDAALDEQMTTLAAHTAGYAAYRTETEQRLAALEERLETVEGTLRLVGRMQADNDSLRRLVDRHSHYRTDGSVRAEPSAEPSLRIAREGRCACGAGAGVDESYTHETTDCLACGGLIRLSDRTQLPVLVRERGT